MYIPKEWLKNPNNEKEIRTIIAKYGGCFQFEDYSSKIETRLKELGEDKILEELKKGTFLCGR